MDWRIKTLMTAIFLLAAFAVLSSRSSAVLPFPHNIDDKNKYLSRQLNFESAKNSERKGFFVRTVDDPVAFFTAALAVLTGLFLLQLLDSGA